MNKTLGLKIYIIFFAMFSIDHFLKTLRGKELNCLVCSYLIDTNTRSKFHQNLWNSSGKCFTNWSFLHGMILIVDLLLSWVIGQPVQGLLNKELSILITWQDLKISTKFVNISPFKKAETGHTLQGLVIVLEMFVKLIKQSLMKTKRSQ